MSSEAPPPFAQRMLGLLEPAQLMAWAMSHYFRVCSEAVKSGQILAPITQTRRLRDEAFGKFWFEFSCKFSENENPNPSMASRQKETEEINPVHLFSSHHPLPQLHLYQYQVQKPLTKSAQPNRQTTTDPITNEQPQPVGSSALIPPLLRTATGTVLDVGPGTGTQMPLLTSPSITALYGAEPCTGLHKELRARAVAEGISDKYHILPCGAAAGELLPALKATGTGVVDGLEGDVRVGIFDTILCVRVLCSVPKMERTIGELYELLKPGGKLLVTEHVVNPWWRAKGSVLARVAQAVYQFFGWSWFIGDCCMTRDVEGALRKAADGDGGWGSFELERSFEWSAMPYISGTLVKKGI
ncbi:hypothetical protein N7508_002138 [Penicillium antarcticum]|uniref:uncharacterized protein n=1 Tax=Penicillium antarcticum TaxID=416450 RepID=UPI002395756D|nr:uncharacterized protein N7508_002138 [Penicillium antarcticum]KAJ5317630.1 hypothetical protein N7508_002138 [Penicillium antarcticum]